MNKLCQTCHRPPSLRVGLSQYRGDPLKSVEKCEDPIHDAADLAEEMYELLDPTYQKYIARRIIEWRVSVGIENEETTA